ncbi:MAG: tetratricopeptide repeat protein, partial [Rhizomicrobium sp.]
MDEAVTCYRQVLALKPDLASAHHNLGNALFGQGNLEQAEASYRRALTLQPSLASAHNNLGIVFYERDKLDEAMACYREAIALEPDYAEALNNLGAALCRRGAFDEGEAFIRRALALKPGIAGAHDNLGALLWEQGKLEEAEASIRRALALAPGFTRALDNLGSMLTDQGRLNEAIAIYRQLLQIRPGDSDGLNGLATVLAARGDTARALETILQSLQIKETASAKRIFVDIVRQHRWSADSREARRAMARALTEPWARPDELAHTSASLIKQSAPIGVCVARAAQAWPHSLSASELFGPDGPKMPADDGLLLALLVSAQNTDVELERFFTMARRLLLEAAEGDGADDAGMGFYAALARQCFINEYVFFHSEEEICRAGGLRDALVAALESGTPISSLRLLVVAAYFPLHSLSGAARLLDGVWPEPVSAVLVQQVREPQEEARLRATIPRLSPIEDSISRLVQNQYEENPYPRWVRMPSIERANTIIRYLRRKCPLADFQSGRGGKMVDFLSAGCGTGQLALEIAQ